MFGRGPSLLTIVYIIVGVFVASNNQYFEHLSKVEQIISAILAVLLWPLVLLDVNLHLNG